MAFELVNGGTGFLIQRPLLLSTRPYVRWGGYESILAWDDKTCRWVDIHRGWLGYAATQRFMKAHLYRETYRGV